MIDLSTTYLGLELHSPFVASPGPVTGDPAMWERLEASGAGAIVLPPYQRPALLAGQFYVALRLPGQPMMQGQVRLPQAHGR